MPDEMTIHDILETYDYPWLSRTVLSNTLKAFGVEPCGKKPSNANGGRPAILYKATDVTNMMDSIMSFRDNA